MRWILAAAPARPSSHSFQFPGRSTTSPGIMVASVAGTPQYVPSLSVATISGTGSPALVACCRLAASRTATSGSRFTQSRFVNRRRTRRRRLPLLSTATECNTEDVAPGRTATDATRPPVTSSIQLRAAWESNSLPTQNDLAEGLDRVHQLMRRTDLSERKHAIDDRTQLARVEQRDHVR